MRPWNCFHGSAVISFSTPRPTPSYTRMPTPFRSLLFRSGWGMWQDWEAAKQHWRGNWISLPVVWDQVEQTRHAGTGKRSWIHGHGLSAETRDDWIRHAMHQRIGAGGVVCIEGGYRWSKERLVCCIEIEWTAQTIRYKPVSHGLEVKYIWDRKRDDLNLPDHHDENHFGLLEIHLKK